MKPLFVLIGAFVISVAAFRIIAGDWNVVLSANIAMAIMLCFTALGHFMYTKGMVMMMPEFMPFKKGVVYFTGIAEVVLGIALLYTRFRHASGIILIVFFVLMLPANINAAIKHIDYQKGTFDGSGPAYLWFRVPLQILFIIWVYFSAVN